jgi:hypothetical protein
MADVKERRRRWRGPLGAPYSVAQAEFPEFAFETCELPHTRPEIHRGIGESV